MLGREPFSFGKNWAEFVDKHYSDERLEAARVHLLEFLELPDLSGLTFLDAGSGSGLHSAAAIRAGAREVVSFDVDPDSVKTTERLRASLGNPPNWHVRLGSVLDRPFLDTLAPADITYSWGVLHHTGRMWEAIENLAARVPKGGRYFIALYVKTDQSDYWLQEKIRYNQASTVGKRVMEAYHVGRHAVLPQLLRLKNPIRLMRDQRRGMSYMTGVRDWLGGYPYEDASVDEVVRFGRRRLALDLTNLHATPGFAEYLFERRPAAE